MSGFFSRGDADRAIKPGELHFAYYLLKEPDELELFPYDDSRDMERCSNVELKVSGAYAAASNLQQRISIRNEDNKYKGVFDTTPGYLFDYHDAKTLLLPPAAVKVELSSGTGGNKALAQLLEGVLLYLEQMRVERIIIPIAEPTTLSRLSGTAGHWIVLVIDIEAYIANTPKMSMVIIDSKSEMFPNFKGNEIFNAVQAVFGEVRDAGRIYLGQQAFGDNLHCGYFALRTIQELLQHYPNELKLNRYASNATLLTSSDIFLTARHRHDINNLLAAIKSFAKLNTSHGIDMIGSLAITGVRSWSKLPDKIITSEKPDLAAKDVEDFLYVSKNPKPQPPERSQSATSASSDDETGPHKR